MAQDIQQLLAKLTALRSEIHKVIIGQEAVVEQIIIGLLAGGNVLLEGVPGLAKTLLISTLAQATDLSFRRIQFTPDLMPTDIIGTEILQNDTSKGGFQFMKGPIFTNIVLADEINRTPPKTQAALLEAMQEKTVSYGGKTHALPTPFFVLATQNPIEQAGTYPLPEAQLDRFLLYIKMDYPSEQAELQMLTETTSNQNKIINKIINSKEITALQAYCRQVTIAPELIKWVNDCVRNTRPQTTRFEEIKEWLRWGAGPRAGQAFILCAKAHAILQKRYAVTPSDLQKVAHSVLRHRILLSFKAEAEQITPESVIDFLLKKLL